MIVRAFYRSIVTSRLRWPALVLALLLSYTGCSAGNFFGPQFTGPAYHAYGDSITAGYTLADPPEQIYAALFALREGVSLTNYANSGDLSCDVPTRQIFAHNDDPSVASATLYTLLISTNDVDTKGTGAYEQTFNLCHQASIAWLALPREYKLAASAAVVAGVSHVETGNNWNALCTDAPGATITFLLQHASAGAVYVWYRIRDGNGGAFSYALDGAKLGTLQTSPAAAIATQNGTTDSLALLRIPSVAAGAHTLVLTQTAGAGSGMGVVAVGLPPGTPIAGQPRILVGTTPLQAPLLTNFGGLCITNTAPCLAYIADITANVNLIASDGLKVQLFDSRKYMTGTAADMNDNLHPNTVGHMEIAHALEDVY